MYSMIGKKGGKTVGIGRGGKNLIKKRKNVSILCKVLQRIGISGSISSSC